MRLILWALALATLLGLGWLFAGRGEWVSWVLDTQRAMQNAMAGHLRGLRSGVPHAALALHLAAFTYGFVHAAGPGHGKALIGAAALGSKVGALRISIVALVASLAQGAWAVGLVYGGLAVLRISASALVDTADRVLMPASYAMIGSIGLYLIWRGLRAWPRRATARPAHGDDHIHDAQCGCGHKHGPDESDIARLTSLRATLALIGAIAVRPCTGAVMLLVICWQFGLVLIGITAVASMAIGTALVTVIAANAAVFARTHALAGAGRLGQVAGYAFPTLQILAGGLIALAAGSVLGALLA